MNDMIIRVKWKPEDVSSKRDVAWQRKYVADHIRSALEAYGSRIEIDKGFIEDAVVFSYEDLGDYPEEAHGDILELIEDVKSQIVEGAAGDVPTFPCGYCKHRFYAGELAANDGYCHSCAEARPLTAEEIEDEKADIEYHRKREEDML
jgi:hypothetical protein